MGMLVAGMPNEKCVPVLSLCVKGTNAEERSVIFMQRNTQGLLIE